MGYEFIRISATGSDGAGKDTAWRNAKPLLSKNIKILKIGKPSSIIEKGEERYVNVEISRQLDVFHEWADYKKSKKLTSIANMLYVMFQWRIQEPLWEKLIKPDLIFSLRDGYV